MENDSDLVKDEPTVIKDECGDSMWDAVLEQDIKACGEKAVSKNMASSPPDIDAV